ncbi:hypothetical protein ACFSZS_10400 [Seohaeicola zhoushanensis]
MATWKNLQEHDLTRENLVALLNNEIPAIRIKGFATPRNARSSRRPPSRGT